MGTFPNGNNRYQDQAHPNINVTSSEKGRPKIPTENLGEYPNQTFWC